jgi:hypothetical protein
MRRFDIINYLIKLYNYKSYLEIGINRKINFKRIIIDHKDGVDPNVDCDFIMTSDKFFEINKNTYDIVFIDGLHQDAQVTRDINNSLKILNENGIILLHDCNPKRAHHQRDEYLGSGVWNGTVWKAVVRLRSTNPNLYISVVNTDTGVGIIKKGSQDLINIKEEDINYQFFRKNKKMMLNLISIEEFLSIFK